MNPTIQFLLTCTNILSVKSSVKFNGGLINHDRCSTSVEGGAARESHLSPRSWCGSKAVISQNPTTPSNKWPGKINGQATITSLRLFAFHLSAFTFSGSSRTLDPQLLLLGPVLLAASPAFPTRLVTMESNNKAPHSFIWASKLLLRPGLFLTIVICAKF